VSLFRAETRRLTKRRFTRFLVIGLTVILAAIAVGMFVTNHKNTPETIAAAQAKADREYQTAVQQTTKDKAECQAAQGTANATNWPPNCEGLWEPTPADFQAEWFMDPMFVFKEQFGDMITTLAAILALMAFVIGASFVGAEWNSGGMMNLLLWRPQRLKVLSTKLGALLVGLTVLTVIYSAIWTGIFALIGNLRGSMDGMTSGAWQSTALTEVRGLVLVLVAGAIGFGLASIGRHTAVAMGVAIGVIIIFQFGLGTVLALAKVKFVEAYLVPIWAQAWMAKSVEVFDYESCNFSGGGGCEPDSLTITWPMAGGVLAAVLVLVVGVAMWTMRSRDIT
jgi:ABC-2 type transport system permease protein